MDASLFYMDFLELGIIMHRSRWQTGVTGHMSNRAHIWHVFVKCQKIKHLDYGEGSQKKINWHNEVHTYWRQFWHHIWWSLKTLKMSIEIIFGQFRWPSYLTSKLTSISVNLIMSIYFSFVNLLHSLHVWLFDIWHLFDNLTSFWHFDTSIKLKPPQPAQGYFLILENTSPSCGFTDSITL